MIDPQDQLPSPVELCDLIDRVAEQTGDPAIVRAARAVRQLPPGRPAIDDAAAIKEIEHLIRSGIVATLGEALRRVARSRTPRGGKTSAVYERLRLKTVHLKISASQ